jgi:TrmH family RNA methyltransferase
VAEGEDLVDAATSVEIEPVELLVAGHNVEPALLAEVSALGHPARVIGVFRRGDLRRGAVPDVGVALWRVGDPGNVGTLIRAADALGPAFVALSPDSADPTGPRALRASMGAVFRVPLVDLEAAPRPWIALVPAGGKTLAHVAGVAKATFVLGAEREGLPAEILLRCDEVATIPLTAGADSLNVAMAGTIALYEHARSMRVEKK